MPPLADTLPAWKALEQHRRELQGRHLRALFAADPGRFRRFSLEACGLLMDYSRHRITEETRRRLLELAREVRLAHWIERMFAGEAVNATEGRAALHVALRRRAPGPFPTPAHDVMPAVREVLARMHAFTRAVRDGTWRGYSGRPVRSIVNIGIGGSDLGPAMATRALACWGSPALDAHFVSGLDSSQLGAVLRRVDPETTLFIVASKTFTTQETLTNARSAREWLLAHAGGEARAVARHFVAVSSAPARTAEFGIDAANVFEFWDWVGGRYSLCSAIGLAVAAALGMEPFEELLAGASEMDEHFRSEPFARNLPVLMGLLGVWYRNFLHTASHAVLPYDWALRAFPDYLQQLEMESNGKRVTREGEALGYASGPVVWGGPGNNGQHAFYQLLHQGTDLIPVDLIVPARSQEPLPGHETALIANALAQAEALMYGRSAAEARELLAAQGLAGEALEAAVPHRVLPGNQPSTALLYERLTPRVLGALVALYEHKVFVQAVCWGVNPFDQWGVELGKTLVRDIQPALEGEPGAAPRDATTGALLEWLRRRRGTE